METTHKNQLKQRFERDKKEWIVVVTNTIKEKGKVLKLRTNFYSANYTFENVLHKIELDLMTNLYHGFTEPIEVQMKEIK